MSHFRRALGWLFLLSGITAGITISIAALFARRLTKPLPQRLWATPGDLGMAFEDVRFRALDGVRLSGWFIPATTSIRKGAAIVLVHGMWWNRLGEAADDALSKIIGATPVDLLRLAFGLHHEGFHVLMFDLRNHGESMAKSPVTFGWQEANDLQGALAYLKDRADVDNERIGAIGFSMGANTLLFALPQTRLVKAAIAVQPTTPSYFSKRFGADLLGPLAKLVVPLTELMYSAAGGRRFREFLPAEAAANAGDIPILYLQSTGDPWGGSSDVTQIASVSLNVSGPLWVESVDRYGGYQYLVDNPKIAAAFFEQHFPE